MRQLQRLIVAVWIVGTTAVDAAPGSFYSTQGLGLRHYFPNSRSLGLGGLALALDDRVAISALNPALLSRLTLTRLSASFLHETAGATTTLQSGRVTDSNVAGAQFFLPLGKGMGFSAGIRPYTAIEYSFANQGALSDVEFVEQLTGKGGVNTAFLAAALTIAGRVHLGVRGNAYFGRVRRTWEVNYASTDFTNTRDEISSSLRGYGVTLGALLSLSSRWHVGAILTPGFSVTAETNLESRSGADSPSQGSEYEIPIEYGLGTTLNPVGRLLLGADLLMQRWSDFKRDSQKMIGWEDALRIGGGVELRGDPSLAAGFFRRLSYRFGAYYWRLGIQAPEGQRVDELFATFGIGVPFSRNRGRIDVAFQAGKRGKRPDNPVEENVLRIAVSITGGERWFVQRR